jgi:GntR family transcriptional regulator, transcriptional repressor for pyruvate dehydrogenase complex
MPIQAVESQRLYRQIADQLRDLILSGEFPVGSRLPAERVLSAQLRVSRPSLREAIIALEVEGLVEVRPGSGIHVIQNDHRGSEAPASSPVHGPFEVLQARLILEGELAAKAAENATPDVVELLRAALDHMRHDCESGRMPFDGDRDFHRLIAEAAGNGPLIQTVTALYDERNNPLFKKIGQHFENIASWRKAIGEHEAIFRAIQSGDSMAARLAMHAHLHLSQARYEDTWPQTQTPLTENII